MVTPSSTAGSPTEPSAAPDKSKRKASRELEAELSASPLLERNKNKTSISKMHRTPQPNLTQTKLTGFTVAQGASAPSGAAPVAGTTPAGTQAAMELGAAPPAAGAGEQLTADFFRNLIGENTKQITSRIDNLSQDVLALTKSVADNRTEIGKNSDQIRQQSSVIEEQKALLAELGGRVAALESGDARPTSVAVSGNTAAPRSSDFLYARRSVRVWPVDSTSEDTLWKGVGEFIHSALKIPEADVSQVDIEKIVPLEKPRIPVGNLNNKVLVTFFCPRKRDMLMSGTPNLASFTDSAGRPTAGLRLEIPKELDPTFRLLSRFCTRLRARHGVGTKRHVKFDDFEASLYINVKLPGDTEWSRVSPAMAKADLDQSSREENAGILKRLANSGNPTLDGPRKRLAAPPLARPATVALTSETTAAGAAATSGVRPRTWVPRAAGPVT